MNNITTITHEKYDTNEEIELYRLECEESLPMDFCTLLNCTPQALANNCGFLASYVKNFSYENKFYILIAYAHEFNDDFWVNAYLRTIETRSNNIYRSDKKIDFNFKKINDLNFIQEKCLQPQFLKLCNYIQNDTIRSLVSNLYEEFKKNKLNQSEKKSIKNIATMMPKKIETPPPVSKKTNAPKTAISYAFQECVNKKEEKKLNYNFEICQPEYLHPRSRVQAKFYLRINKEFRANISPKIQKALMKNFAKSAIVLYDLNAKVIALQLLSENEKHENAALFAKTGASGNVDIALKSAFKKFNIHDYPFLPLSSIPISFEFDDNKIIFSVDEFLNFKQIK